MNVFSFKSVLGYVLKLGKQANQATDSITRPQKAAGGNERQMP